MGLFGLMSGKRKLPAVVQEAVAAMRPQIESARGSYSSAETFETYLSSSNCAAFLHGFVLLFAAKHGVKAPELLWAATVQTFDQVFGNRLGSSIISSLQQSLRQGTADCWQDEGARAGRYFDKERLTLLESFLHGGVK